MRATIVLTVLALGCRSAPDVVRAGALEIRDAYAFEPVLGDVAPAYLSIRNTGAEPDRLGGAEAAEVGSVMIHQQVETAGQTVMRHLEAVEIPSTLSCTSIGRAMRGCAFRSWATVTVSRKGQRT